MPKNPIKSKKGVWVSGVHQAMANHFKVSLDQWFDSLDTPYAKSIEGLISKEKVISIIANNLKISPKKLKKLFVNTYRKKLIDNKELYKIAFKLKKKGYKIAILSDQWPVSKEALIKRRYARKFDVVIISCDVGVRKPSLKIYKILLKKLNLPAEECAFIDNQVWNIKPAKKLGMKTILFKNNKNTIRDLQKLGVKI